METFLMYFLFAVGLVLIIKGGDFFVDAAAWLAEVSGIPHFIVGATIVGFATSLPEILVSVFAAAGGDVEMATGNAVGSVTANTGLILGISLLAMPMVIRLRKYYPQVILLTAAIVAIFLFGLSGEITIVASIVLTLMFVLFVIMNVRDAKSSISENAEAVAAERENITKGIVAKKIVLFVLGCAGIIGGSELLVNYGPAIAKKQASLSVGNILGSNIIDMTFVLPPCMLAYGKPLPVSNGTLFVDLPALFLLTIACFLPTVFTKKFSRWQGVLMLVGYVGYIAYTFITH